jgi:hypothetical protein
VVTNVTHQHVSQSPDIVLVQSINVSQAVLFDPTTRVDVVGDARIHMMDLHAADTTLCFQAFPLALLGGLNPPAAGVVMTRTCNRHVRWRPAQTRRSGEPTEQGSFQTDPA